MDTRAHVAAEIELLQLAVVQMSQHGDGQQFELFPRRPPSSFHHARATGGVEGQELDPQIPRRRHGTLECVGDVVELEIQKHAPRIAPSLTDRLRSPANECLKTDFEHPDPRSEELAPAAERLAIGSVESHRHAVERV